MAAPSAAPHPVTSACAVFAESEVISRINDGTDVADIVAGVLASIASKVGTLLGRVGGNGPVLLLGGLGKVAALPRLIEQVAQRPVCTPAIDPQLGPAFGAALLARGRRFGDRS
jgi:activator of 2-hydroxyglutaryl-CoA dehydratase